MTTQFTRGKKECHIYYFSNKETEKCQNAPLSSVSPSRHKPQVYWFAPKTQSFVSTLRLPSTSSPSAGLISSKPEARHLSAHTYHSFLLLYIPMLQEFSAAGILTAAAKWSPTTSQETWHCHLHMLPGGLHEHCQFCCAHSIKADLVSGKEVQDWLEVRKTLLLQKNNRAQYE